MFFALNQKEIADSLVKSFHYSARPPANVQLVGTWHEAGGLFGESGDAVAACYFSVPPTRWNEYVLELSRLVRKEDVQISLTGLIAECCHWLKRKKMVDLVVSFADPTFGHHGGIYQAASWHYAGKRERACDGLVINGNFVPGRTCNYLYGTRSAAKLAEQRPLWEIEPQYDEGKHLYWKPLTNKGKKQAQRMKLESLPYPKPKQAIACSA